MTALPCEPWTTADRLCCPDETPVLDCDGLPVVPTYPWTDDELIMVASRMLYHATCERFTGECTNNELRPCKCSCPVGQCCGCRLQVVALAGRYPVLEVTEVKINAVVLPASDYRLDEFSRLVRIDGQPWPHVQDLAADPDTDPDTFVIRYTVGRAVPIDLQHAAALLACELKKACGGQSCDLPDGVTHVIRDGLEFDMVPQGITNQITQGKGLFGIPQIDMIVNQYKPCEKTQYTPKRRLFFADEAPDGSIRS